eukprot:GHVS01038072.1.p1 GENE.GHVS01038072.1~~GHVS01038072.1.p1  ORF type:complete len:125 (-),score=12.20 GHVS01038072.1:84-458(-)
MYLCTKHMSVSMFIYSYPSTLYVPHSHVHIRTNTWYTHTLTTTTTTNTNICISYFYISYRHLLLLLLQLGGLVGGIAADAWGRRFTLGLSDAFVVIGSLMLYVSHTFGVQLTNATAGERAHTQL